MRQIKNLVHLFMAMIANISYGFPSRKLKVIGVTGTDGKTTTCYIIYHILQAAGLNPGMITTVEAFIGRRSLPTGLHVTTPSSFQLQSLISKMVHNGCDYLILETTSHGLDQNRVFGIEYQVSAVTNVTSEHLDYHKTYENYLKTKSRLLRVSKVSILNKCDRSYRELKKFTKQTITYGLDCGAEINSMDLENIDMKLPEKYNKENALAAIAVARALNINEDAIKEGIEKMRGVKGRMDVLQEKPFKVIVDFAHTPNSLEKSLTEARKSTPRKLISVFGCAGLRDKFKRPLMGEVAGKLADIVVVTAEDPRTEDLSEINRQIVDGLKRTRKTLGGDYFVIEDRKEAIDTAVNKLAGEGDTVIITGKGHERSMCFGKKEYPWDDIKITKKLLTPTQKR